MVEVERRSARRIVDPVTKKVVKSARTVASGSVWGRSGSGGPDPGINHKLCTYDLAEAIKQREARSLRIDVFGE